MKLLYPDGSIRGADSQLKEMGPAVKAAVEAGDWPVENDGWARLTIPIEDLAFSTRELSKIGAELEVLSPPDLRAGITDVARRMAALYAEDSSSRRASPI